jgi:hypothetical protein
MHGGDGVGPSMDFRDLSRAVLGLGQVLQHSWEAGVLSGKVCRDGNDKVGRGVRG